MDKIGKDVEVIGFPISLGSKKRGTELAPSALRRSGLIGEMRKQGIRTFDEGDVRINNSKLGGRSNARNLDQILGYARLLSQRVDGALSKGRFPLVLGGDHTTALGSILGLHSYSKKRCGAIYFDAHPDFNTPLTTPSGNVHGMTLALMSGQYNHKGLPDICLDPKKIAVVGVRSIDSKERELIKKAGIHVFTADDVQRMGIEKVTEEAIKIASREGAYVYVSVDIDVVDPALAPGTGTPVVGGLLAREMKMALRKIFLSGKMKLFELSELNPKFDSKGITLDIAVELILIALGKDTSESLL